MNQPSSDLNRKMLNAELQWIDRAGLVVCLTLFFSLLCREIFFADDFSSPPPTQRANAKKVASEVLPTSDLYSKRLKRLEELSHILSQQKNPEMHHYLERAQIQLSLAQHDDVQPKEEANDYLEAALHDVNTYIKSLAANAAPRRNSNNLGGYLSLPPSPYPYKLLAEIYRARSDIPKEREALNTLRDIYHQRLSQITPPPADDIKNDLMTIESIKMRLHELNDPIRK